MNSQPKNSSNLMIDKDKSNEEFDNESCLYIPNYSNYYPRENKNKNKNSIISLQNSIQKGLESNKYISSSNYNSNIEDDNFNSINKSDQIKNKFPEKIVKRKSTGKKFKAYNKKGSLGSIYKSKEKFVQKMKNINLQKYKTHQNKKRFDIIMKFSLYVMSNIMNFLAIFNYIAQTFFEDNQENKSIHNFLVYVELSLTFYFLFEYIFFIFNLRGNYLKNIISIDSFIDIITIIPSIITYFISFRGIKIYFIRIFRIFRVFRILRVYKSLRMISNESSEENPSKKLVNFDPIKLQFVTIVVVLICVFFIGAGLVLGINDLTQNAFSIDKFNFIDATYFMIVTYTTVGFGDIFPFNTITRFMMIIGIFSLFFIVSNQISYLANLLKFWGPGLYNFTGSGHIIIICDETINLELLLTKILNLQKEKKYFLIISKVIKELPVKSFPYKKAILYNTDVIDMELMDLINIEKSSAIFIFSSKKNYNCEKYDKISEFYLLRIEQNCKIPPIFIQTLNSGNLINRNLNFNQKLNSSKNSLSYENENSKIIFSKKKIFKKFIPIWKLKTLILSKCSFNSGFAAFIQNLIFNDFQRPINFENYSEILQNYMLGCENKIVVEILPKFFTGKNFSDSMYIIYFKSINDYFVKVSTDEKKQNRPVLLLGIYDNERSEILQEDCFEIFPSEYLINQGSYGIFITYDDENYLRNMLSFFDSFSFKKNHESQIETLKYSMISYAKFEQNSNEGNLGNLNLKDNVNNNNWKFNKGDVNTKPPIYRSKFIPGKTNSNSLLNVRQRGKIWDELVNYDEFLAIKKINSEDRVQNFDKDFDINKLKYSKFKNIKKSKTFENDNVEEEEFIESDFNNKNSSNENKNFKRNKINKSFTEKRFNVFSDNDNVNELKKSKSLKGSKHSLNFSNSDNVNSRNSFDIPFSNKLNSSKINPDIIKNPIETSRNNLNKNKKTSYKDLQAKINKIKFQEEDNSNNDNSKEDNNSINSNLKDSNIYKDYKTKKSSLGITNKKIFTTIDMKKKKFKQKMTIKKSKSIREKTQVNLFGYGFINEKNFKNKHTAGNLGFLYESNKDNLTEIFSFSNSQLNLKANKLYYNQLKIKKEKFNQDFHEKENLQFSEFNIFDLEKDNVSMRFENHIVIVGFHPILNKLIKLFFLHHERDICIFGTSDSDEVSLIKLLKQFHNVYYFKGSPENPFHLINGGLNKAFLVIFLNEILYGKTQEDMQKILMYKSIDYFFDVDMILELWKSKSSRLIGNVPLLDNGEIEQNEFLHPSFMAGRLLYLSHFETFSVKSYLENKPTDALIHLLSLGIRTKKSPKGLEYIENHKESHGMPIIMTIEIPEFYHDKEYYILVDDLLKLNPPALPLGIYIENPMDYTRKTFLGEVKKNKKPNGDYEIEITTSYKKTLINLNNFDKVDKLQYDGLSTLRELSYNDKATLDIVDLNNTPLPVFITNPNPGFLIRKNTKILILYYHLTEEKNIKRKISNSNTIFSQRTIGLKNIAGNNFKRLKTINDTNWNLQYKLKEKQKLIFGYYNILKNKLVEKFDKKFKEIKNILKNKKSLPYGVNENGYGNDDIEII